MSRSAKYKCLCGGDACACLAYGVEDVHLVHVSCPTCGLSGPEATNTQDAVNRWREGQDILKQGCQAELREQLTLVENTLAAEHGVASNLTEGWDYDGSIWTREVRVSPAPPLFLNIWPHKLGKWFWAVLVDGKWDETEQGMAESIVQAMRAAEEASCLMVEIRGGVVPTKEQP